METIYLSIAGFAVGIEFKDTEMTAVKNFYKKNIIEQLSDFMISKPQKKVDFTIEFVWDEREEIIYRSMEKKYFIQFYKTRSERRIECYYQISFFQFFHVLYAALEKLLEKHEGFMLHASALGQENVSLFVGSSGAGKTTITQFLKGIAPIRADDALALRKVGNTYVFYQLPFYEKVTPLIKRKEPYALGEIFFLHKSSKMKVVRVKNELTVLEKLLGQVYTSGLTRQQMSNIKNFIAAADTFYNLHFPKDKKRVKDFFTTAYEL